MPASLGNLASDFLGVTGVQVVMVAVADEAFFRLVGALVEVTRADGQQYSAYSVRGKRFGYYWPRTRTVGLKQTITEQRALVAERPDVFEEQYTSGGFGWVVVQLDGIAEDELAELVFEAWRLTAPEDLVAEVPDLATTRPKGRKTRVR